MKRTLLYLSLSSFTALNLGACTAPTTLTSRAGYSINTLSAGTLSWQAQRTSRIVMQQYDYSCGAAALATMMTHYFGMPVSELDLLGDVERLFDEEEMKVIRSAGLSLTELGTLANEHGYQSAAIKLDPAALANLPGPVIIFLRTDDYRHFAVLREVVNGLARVADPSRGNLSMPVPELLDIWHGETLVLGREGFGVPEEHRLRADVRAIANPRYLDLLPPRQSPFIRIPQ